MYKIRWIILQVIIYMYKLNFMYSILMWSAILICFIYLFKNRVV